MDLRLPLPAASHWRIQSVQRCYKPRVCTLTTAGHCLAILLALVWLDALRFLSQRSQHAARHTRNLELEVPRHDLVGTRLQLAGVGKLYGSPAVPAFIG